MSDKEYPHGRRGFAGMTAEQQREIASRGGRAAHAQGKAHRWSAEEAKEAGRKGGMASKRKAREPYPLDAAQGGNSPE